MAKVIFRICIPITIVVFILFTKTTIADVDDAPLTEFIGMPMPFLCDGWHTSLSFQVFISEMFFDLLCYFVVITTIILLIHKYIVTIRVGKIATLTSYVIAAVLVTILCLLLFQSDNLIYVNRPFKYRPISSSYKFIWQTRSQSTLESYQFKK